MGNQVSHYHNMITLHSTVLGQIFFLYFLLYECKKKLIKFLNWGVKKGYKKLNLCTGMTKVGINYINFWGRIYNFLYVLLHTSSNIIVRGPVSLQLVFVTLKNLSIQIN